MNKTLCLVTFAAGALIGSAASYFIIKKKYNQLMEEEIDSVKKAFERKYEKRQIESIETINDSELPTSAKGEEDEIDKYKTMTNYYQISDNKKPYLIAPEELGEYDDYRIVGLTYYSDGVLTDEAGEPIKNITELVGDALDHFGDFEDDAVHVRNEALETDYEILRDPQKYSEV